MLFRSPAKVGTWSVPGLCAWAAGALVFYLAQPVGGVLPTLAVSSATYLLLRWFASRSR